METTIYLLRHSKTLNVTKEKASETYQEYNEKLCLSIEGEDLARTILNKEEFKNIDYVYSSNYVRAIQTAKYLAENNNTNVIVNEDFGERKFGVDQIKDLPENFEGHQFNDENYKLTNGESRKEVTERMYKALMKLLEESKGKKIAIVSHATALSWLLSKWCETNYQGPYKFNNEEFFDGRWKYCESFKLIFEDEELKSIENLK